MAKGFPSYGIIIAGHFCKRVTIYVSFLQQDILGESRALKIFNSLKTLSLVFLWQEYCILYKSLWFFLAFVWVFPPSCTRFCPPLKLRGDEEGLRELR